MAAHQAPPSLGFSRQEHWSGLPFPSPMHESEKWKWSCSVVSDSSRPPGLQPTRLLHPWDFPGKRAWVACQVCHIWPLLCWAMYPLGPLSGEFFFFFYHKWVLSFVDNLFCIYWDDHVVLFKLLIWCITLTGLWLLKVPCIPGMNPTWSWCMIFLMYCWIQIASILLSIFTSIFISDISL